MTKASPRPRRLLLATALAISFTWFAAPPAAVAAPAAPGNLSPSGAVSSNSPVLSWNAVAGAARYEVQVDDDPGFGTPVFTSNTTNNRSAPDKVLPAGVISWRVRALDASNAASGWAVETITVAETSVPTPVSPVGGQALTQPSQPPLLVWEAVQGANKYTVQVDETIDFVSPLVNSETQTTSLVAPNPLPAGEYFWRVKASKATGVDSVFSDPQDFNIVAQAAPTTNSSGLPSEGAVEDVELTWQPVAGAAYYQLQVAADSDFNTIVDDQSGTSAKVYGTRYSPAVTYDNDQYFWRVRAVDAAGNRLAWSGTRQFIRTWPDQPTARYPLGDGSPITHVSSPMFFQWTPVQHASQYELQLGTQANFSPGTYTNCQTAGTTYTPGLFGINHDTGQVSQRTHEQCDVIPGQVYYWRVRPLDRPFSNPGVEGLYSETQVFVYDDDDVFGTVSPANGQTVDIPTFTWGSVKGAEKYELTISNGTGQTVKSGITTYATSYTPVNMSALDPTKNPYTWTIVAKNPDGSAASLIHSNTFNVSGQLPDTPAAPLVALSGVAADPDTVRAPKLQWEPYPGANEYRVFAGPAGSGTLFPANQQDALDVKLPYPAMTDTWTWFLNPGSYDWYVAAYNNGAFLAQSAVNTFTIKQLDAVAGQAVALDGLTHVSDNGCDNAVDGSPDICDNVPSTPVFSWDPVPGAGFYVVYLSKDSTFTNLVEPLATLGATSNTFYAPTMSAFASTLPDSNADTPYWWFVRPCKSPSNCGPNPVSTSGKATNKFRKSSPGVALISPGIDATVTTPDVRLDWTDYFDTNQATIWAATGEKSPQAAMQYRVQVSIDPSFGSFVENVLVDQSVYTSPTRLYPEGELYWRVQAVDADGNGLAWSATRSFTKSTQQIVLQTPTSGMTVGGTTAFRWAPQHALGSYEIEVYANNDTAASLSNRLFSITTKQNAYVWTKPVPAAVVPYVWRVRRKDSSSPSNNGPWSVWGTFTSSGSVPTLLTPAAGADQPANGPLFTWSEVPGATTYVLNTRSTTSSATIPGTPKTTPATAWATTGKVPDGSWEWRVTAQDAGGKPLGSSAWRGFQVDGSAPTVTAYSPVGSVSPSVNVVAKFSEPVVGVGKSTFKVRRKGTTKAISAVITMNSTRKKAILNPVVSLRRGKQYIVKLTTGIKDDRGNSLVAKTWTFTVN